MTKIIINTFYGIIYFLYQQQFGKLWLLFTTTTVNTCPIIILVHVHFIKDHKEIEKVQKRATKLVKSISHLPYGERLKKLSLTTLYYRRQRADVLIKGMDKLDIGIFKELNSRPSINNSLKLIKSRALTSHKQFSFSHRVIND